MATYVLKGKKGAPTQPRELAALSVGSRSSCALSLEDPLVAEVHCAFEWADGAFFVEDLRSSTGTYVNGLAVDGRAALADGDEVVVGVTRIKLGIAAGKSELVLTVKEGGFHFDAKADPLRWSKDETAFGKFRPLRVGMLATVVVLVVALPFCFVGPTARSVQDFGPLASVHRMDDPRFAAAHDALPADSQGCAACHEPGRGATAARCAACHQDVVSAVRHPFFGPDAWGSGCADCHLDHAGGDGAALRGAADPAACKRCHPADVQARIDAGAAASADLTARLAERARAAGLDAAEAGGATFVVDVAYDTFSHRDHLKAGVACADCHVRAATPAPAGAAAPRREFARVTFETCQACHAAGATHPRAPRDAAGAPAKRFRADWHGTDDNGQGCLQCHATTHEAALRTSETVDRRTSFATGASRSHGPEFAAFKGGKDDCATCHVRGEPAAREFPPRPFRHGTHCAPPAGNDAAARATASADCASCHREQRAATTLAATSRDGSYAGPAGESCRTCHGETPAPRPAPAAGSTPESRRTRVEFPHSRHLGPHAGVAGAETPRSLADGCLSCHELERGTGGAHAAEIRTKPAAADCRACHAGHRDVAGGSCADCHREGDPVYAGRPRSKAWPRPTGFSHFSSGHAEPTARDCAACHAGAASVADAATLSAVSAPSESDPSCRDCHLTRGARFHWR